MANRKYQTTEQMLAQARQSAHIKAAMTLKDKADSWLDGLDPRDPSTQRDAALDVLDAHGGDCTPEQLRDGLRTLLGLRGPEALGALAMAQSYLIAEGWARLTVARHEVHVVMDPEPTKDQLDARFTNGLATLGRKAEAQAEGRSLPSIRSMSRREAGK